MRTLPASVREFACKSGRRCANSPAHGTGGSAPMQDDLISPVRWVEEDRGYDTPCWIWSGAIRAYDGYGQITRDGRPRVAHRALYQDRFGVVPAGMDLHHLCEVKACVNLDHLELLTHAEHAARHNPVLSHCRRGHSMDDAYYPPVGDRQCRTCRRERESARAARLKVARATQPRKPSLPTRGGNTAELRRRAKALRVAGFTYQQIADELGSSDTSARRWCKHEEAA